MSTVEDMSTTPVGLSNRSQWFGFLAGPLTWFLHMIVFYVLAEFGCTPGADNRYFTYESVVTAIVVVTIAATTVTVFSGTIAFRNLRRTAQVDTDRYLMADREHFMSWMGLWCSVLFGLAMLIEMGVLFFFDSCASLMGGI